MSNIILPKAIIKAESVNPKRLVIYSKPKIGKTTAFAGLENNLILDLEKGSNFVDALKIKINSVEELIEVGKKIKEEGNPYKYCTIDTVTALEEMVLPLALKKYKATPLGKSSTITNVLTLPQGAG